MGQQPLTQNPYPSIGQDLSIGLTAIISAVPNNPTIDQLVLAVYNYIEPLFYPNSSVQVQTEIKSVAYNAINSYRNNLVLGGNAMFNGIQFPFIQMMIGGNAGFVAPDSFADWLKDIEDNIGTSDLSVSEQTPLFLSTTLGNSANAYWIAELANPASQWLKFFSTNAGQNYMNSLLWTKAAINGALASYGASPVGLIEPSTNFVTTRMVSALIGALIVTAGKVIFNWIPRITKPLLLNRTRVTNLQNNGSGPQYGQATTSVFSPEICYSQNCPGGSWTDGNYSDPGPCHSCQTCDFVVAANTAVG